MTTLETISGIRARIYTLPHQPPFMTVADLAEVYGSTPKAIAQAVKRNPTRFPERYFFRLTQAEETHMRSQFVTSYGKKRDDLRPLVFTHGGANMLASVLRGDVADRMAVVINDAFTAMEQAAISDAQNMVLKLQSQVSAKVIYGHIVRHVEASADFETLWRNTNYSRPRLLQAVKECIALGLIDAAPRRTQLDMFGNV